MKKTLFFIIALAGILMFNSCEKEGDKPVLDMGNVDHPVVSAPSNNAEYVLYEEQQNQLWEKISWVAADYRAEAGRNWHLLNSDKLGSVTYTVQLDTEADNFKSPITLVSTTETSFSMTVAAINGKLLAMGLAPGQAHNLVMRIKADITDQSGYDNAFSETIKLKITPFAAEVLLPPIYLLGGATEVGWDNSNAIPMYAFTETKFAIVAKLSGGGEIKFIKNLGAWAPQWGTDESGTDVNGPLVYRPTEDVDDPRAIPAPAVAGDYRITADISALKYTITKASETLYLLGDGTPAGWDNNAALPMTKLSPGIFEITVNLGGGSYFKFIETLGQWAPQYGTNDAGTGDGGSLVLRSTEADPDPAAIPIPAPGKYKITANLWKMTYKVIPAQ